MLLDLPPMTAARFAAIEDGVAALLRTRNDVIVTQGEALLPLEAAIKGAAHPGSTALNVVTGPYGQTFGGWLRDAGAKVVDLAVPYDTAVGAERVAAALNEHPEIDFVSLVHAEAATGNTNPIAEIAEVVRQHGALLMLDAVASVAAEPLLTDAWGVDLCVIGGQKAMGGPAGVSAVSVSERAWRRIAANPAAPRRSYLSLLDWKERWTDAGRTQLPHAPAQLEMLALEECLAAIDAETLDAVIARHRAAAAATRAGALALPTLAPYVLRAEDAAPVATTLRTPEGVDAAELAAELRRHAPHLPVQPGGGPLAATMLRLNHYGPAATAETVIATLELLAQATATPAAPAVAAATEAWENAI
ncbi:MULTISPECIES: aminotransferase class V-fold PLP-dependent enzyme [Kitasatospora]|uniref:Putative aspartate aminotransferase n=1 Tax=Kitasatospora setae (strain ATCC 33774 / DSM 43861 / JCM 3304 / KCC A-0304 / NBRC 14216 / KM-6054) TaxID=452652 RepID=E4N051_KITSK|nr:MULTISPECIES: aminotransferase class V-fold PLP-dependent enzyme [Kitasatospora]BAJ31379.1 putative aspartate aminotransferase [Kitasatospora setae KM-6054]